MTETLTGGAKKSKSGSKRKGATTDWQKHVAKFRKSYTGKPTGLFKAAAATYSKKK